MIELRWLEIGSSIKRHVNSPWLAENKERYVLQYRERPFAIAPNGVPYETNWSDWQDVPTVREEE